MLKLIKSVRDTNLGKWDRFLPATRQYVEESVALAHITANESAVQIEEIYQVLKDNDLKFERLEDNIVFEQAVEASIHDKQLLAELRSEELKQKQAERKAQRLARKKVQTMKEELKVTNN